MEDISFYVGSVKGKLTFCLVIVVCIEIQGTVIRFDGIILACQAGNDFVRFGVVELAAEIQRFIIVKDANLGPLRTGLSLAWIFLGKINGGFSLRLYSLIEHVIDIGRCGDANSANVPGIIIREAACGEKKACEEAIPKMIQTIFSWLYSERLIND